MTTPTIDLGAKDQDVKIVVAATGRVVWEGHLFKGDAISLDVHGPSEVSCHFKIDPEHGFREYAYVPIDLEVWTNDGIETNLAGGFHSCPGRWIVGTMMRGRYEA